MSRNSVINNCTILDKIQDTNNNVDGNNTTTVALGATAVFNGEYTLIEGFESVSVLVSATNKGELEYISSIDTLSEDMVEKKVIDKFADNNLTNGERYIFPVYSKFMKIRYTNLGGADSSTKIQTILHKTQLDTLDIHQRRNILHMDNMSFADTIYQLGLIDNSYTQEFQFSGQVDDVLIADGLVTIGDGNLVKLKHVPVTEDSTLYLSSSSASDDGLVLFQYLDEDYAPFTQIGFMDGQNPVSVATNFFRMNLIILGTPSGGTESNIGDVYMATGLVGAYTSGIPDDLTLVHGTMMAGRSNSYSGRFTIPAGFTAVILGDLFSTRVFSSNKVIEFLFGLQGSNGVRLVQISQYLGTGVFGFNDIRLGGLPEKNTLEGLVRTTTNDISIAIFIGGRLYNTDRMKELGIV